MTSGDQEVSCQGVPYNNGDTLSVGYLCLQEVNGIGSLYQIRVYGLEYNID